MKRLLLLLLLLLAPAAHAAPVKISDEGLYFPAQTVDSNIRLCDATGHCSAPKLYKAGANDNCGYPFYYPAARSSFGVADGTPMFCTAEPVGSPAVPPPAALPPGVSELVGLGVLFAHPTTTDVELCKKGFTDCSHAARFTAMPDGGGHYCSAVNFTDVIAGADTCYVVPLWVPSVQTDPCYPPIDVSITLPTITSKNYHYVDVPASVGAAKPMLGYWIDCATGKNDVEYFNLTDIGNLIAAGVKDKVLGNSDAINQWRKAQPVETWSASETAYAKQIKDAQDALLPIVQPAPAPVYKVAKNGAAVTRPAFPVVNGVRKTTKNGDVKIGSLCDGKTVTEAKYFGVGGLPNEAKAGTTIPAGSVAICEAQ